jgi:hypothetical protein
LESVPDSEYTKVFLVLLSPFRLVPRERLDYATAASFLIFSNSSIVLPFNAIRIVYIPTSS